MKNILKIGLTFSLALSLALTSTLFGASAAARTYYAFDFNPAPTILAKTDIVEHKFNTNIAAARIEGIVEVSAGRINIKWVQPDPSGKDSPDSYFLGFAPIADPTKPPKITDMDTFTAAFGQALWWQVNYVPSNQGALTGFYLDLMTKSNQGACIEMAVPSTGSYLVGVASCKIDTYINFNVTYETITVGTSGGGGSTGGGSNNSSGNWDISDLDYVYLAEVIESGEPVSIVDDVSNSVTIWAGGGKATLANGAILDSKSAQINLYKQDDQKWYNITNSKSTLWGLFDNNTPIAESQDYKLTSTADKNIAKISKGKITAGKDDGIIYAQALAGVDKKTQNKGEGAGCVKVEVKQAATVVEIYKGTDTSDTPIKSVSAPLDIPVQVLPLGRYKDGSSLATSSSENTFSIIVDSKSEKYVGVSVNGLEYEKSLNSVRATELGLGLFIKGLELNNDKETKTTIIIQNDQSGKKVKLVAVVGNSVVGTMSDDPPIISVPFDSSGDMTVTTDVLRNNYYTTASSGALTDKAKVFVIEGNYAAIDKQTAEKFVNSGKIKFSGQKLSNVSAKYSGDKIELKIKKGCYDRQYLTVVVAFNANTNPYGDYIGLIPVRFAIGEAEENRTPTP